MELNEVLALLTISGGTVYVTFQISWAIFKEIHNNKKWPPSVSQTVSGHSLIDCLAGGS